MKTKHYNEEKRLYHYKCPTCSKELYSWDMSPMKCAYCRDVVEPVNNTNSMKDQVNEVPNPGSKDAVTQGCQCPVIDNSYGRGYMGTDNFVISGDCPIHNN